MFWKHLTLYILPIIRFFFKPQQILSIPQNIVSSLLRPQELLSIPQNIVGSLSRPQALLSIPQRIVGNLISPLELLLAPQNIIGDLVGPPINELVTKPIDLMLDLSPFHKLRHDGITYHLYKRPNTNSWRRISRKHLKHVNKTLPVKIISHGFLGTHEVKSVQTLKNAYLDNHDYNVILIDWSPFALDLFYLVPARMVRRVGKMVGKMIKAIIKYGVKPEKIHLLGFSLGAHIVSEAGNYATVGRATMLDAARPYMTNYRRLKTAAKFVDVIHTAAPILGIHEPLGTADFYVNGGMVPQPHCKVTDLLIQTCAHDSSWILFSKTIKYGKKFPATACNVNPRWRKVKEKYCKGHVQYMGESVSRKAKGIYFAKTTGTKSRNKPKKSTTSTKSKKKSKKRTRSNSFDRMNF